MSNDRDDLLPVTPEGWPSAETVLLPTRAFLRSWRSQTLSAREFALSDAREHFDSVVGADPALADMAILCVIAEAMQPLEDLAYLGTAWNNPFQSLPNYIRAITYGKFVPNDFWTGVHKWDDERVLVFSGHRGRDPETAETADVLRDVLIQPRGWTQEQEEAATAARVATIKRVRAELAALSQDWRQFSPYFLAYKHGGLAISRTDAIFVGDDVEEVTDDTPRHDPSIAVWTRGGRKQEIQADFNLTPRRLIDHAAGAGRAALRMIDAFIESRLVLSDAIVYNQDGAIIGVRELHIPWTQWLRADDLTEEQWTHIGRGPRVTWTRDE